MLAFARNHRKALLVVFFGAVAAFLVVRALQWTFADKSFAFAELALAMPVGWVLGTLLDPLLWKLPRPANLAIFEVLLAIGFAVNAVLLTIVAWHRKATGRWWGGSDAVERRA